MKKLGKAVLSISLCLLVLGVMGCGNTMSLQTYPGEMQPLSEVAVLISSPHTCPVFTIDDGQFRNLEGKPDTELHLLPGEHSVEVFYQVEGTFLNSFIIEKTTINHNFQAGHVYAIMKTKEPAQNPETYQSMGWTPQIRDLGDAVTYAADNPKYMANSKEWKQLRKDNGLTKSFFDFFKFAKDSSDNEVQSF